MNTLVVYDNTGFIISSISGDSSLREPVGVPFLWVDVPQGKKVTGVDLTTTPHTAMLVDTPKTEIELFKEKMQADLEYLAIMTGVEL